MSDWFARVSFSERIRDKQVVDGESAAGGGGGGGAAGGADGGRES